MRGAIVLLAGLALTGAAHAAPLRVTLTAAGDAAAYAWSFGGRATAEGTVVTHVYGPGTFLATVTATSAAGEVAQARMTVSTVRRAVSLEAPRSARHGEPAVVAGSLRPAVRGARVQIYRGRTHVASARVGANGRFRARLLLRSPGPYHARYGPARSAERTIRLRPRIDASLLGTAPVGSRLVVQPRLVPATAGLSGLARLRPHPDVACPVPLRQARLRHYRGGTPPT